ncbi:MAG: hypothetical protein ACRD29_03545 [Acidimicrobiales bacterium]
METDIPIACSLDGPAREERLAAWRTLAAQADDDSAPAPTTRRLRFRPDAVDLAGVAALVQAELECCPFFRFTLTADAAAVVLAVEAPAEGATLVSALGR